MRLLLLTVVVASTGLRICDAEEQDEAPPEPPQVSSAAAADVEIAGELREPRHGGSIVVAQDHVVEVVPTPEGEVYAYVAAHDGVVPPPDEVELTVQVHVKEGGVRPVHLSWNPTLLRFEGEVEGAVPAPGPAEVLLVVEGHPRRARIRRARVVPRAKVKVHAKGAPPGAKVWLHVPAAKVRVRGNVPRGKAKGHGRVRVRGPKRPKGPKGRVRVDVRGEAPRPPSGRVRVEVRAPKPPPPPEVRGEVKVEGRVGVR